MKKMYIMMTILCYQSCAPSYDHHTYTRKNYETTWGIHTSINLQQCSRYVTRSTKDMSSFIKQVFSCIGVTPLGAPNTVYHYSGYGYSSGYTMMQHGNGHTDIIIRADETTDNVFIDVFSCKSYDPHHLVNIAQDFFDAYKATVDILYR